VIEMADESQREVTSPQIVSRATLRVQWSSRLDLTLVCSAARDFGTRAFALPERFYRGCWLRAEGFQRRARAWCRTGGTALGHTPRSCVFTHPLPVGSEYDVVAAVLGVSGIQSGSLGTAAHAWNMLRLRT
jgi:hypothetical protein